MAVPIRPRRGTQAEFSALNRVYVSGELLLEDQGDGSYRLKAADGVTAYNSLPYVSGAGAPSAHATTHKSGGSDTIRLDEFSSPIDVTTLNATASAHGLLPKLSGNALQFLNGAGAWTTAGQSLFVSVKDYGAIGDGSTNDHTAIMNAYAALPSTGGTIFFPPGYYRVLSPLTFGDGTTTTQSTKQNVRLLGPAGLSGVGGQFTSGADPGPARIVYGGTSQASHVVKFQGPMTCAMDGVGIEGAYNAVYGLFCEHVFRSVFSDIYIYGTKTGVRHTSYPGATGVSIGAADNRWSSVHVMNHAWPGEQATDNATGFDIGTDSILTGLDVARDVFVGCTVVTKDDSNSSSYVIRGADLLTFKNCLAYSVDDGNAYALVCIAPTGPPGNTTLYKHLPYELAFINCALIGRTWFSPDWDVDNNGGWKILFWPVASGDMVDPGTPGRGTPPTRYGCFGVDTRGYFLGMSQFRTFLDDVCYETPTVLFRKPASQTITNTTVEQTIFNFNVPANIMRARTQVLTYQPGSDYVWDRMLRIHVYGTIINSTGVDASAKFRLGISGASIYDSGLFTVTTTASARAFRFDGTVSAGNSSTNQCTTGTLRVFLSTSATGSATDVDFERTGHFETSANMAIVNNMFCAFKWETASANLQCIIKSASVELM